MGGEKRKNYILLSLLFNLFPAFSLLPEIKNF
jgi:hypothetical protein